MSSEDSGIGEVSHQAALVLQAVALVSPAPAELLCERLREESENGSRGEERRERRRVRERGSGGEKRTGRGWGRGGDPEDGICSEMFKSILKASGT